VIPPNPLVLVSRFPRDILKRLIPDVSTVWVVVLLLITTVLLNSLIFKPVLRVIDERSRAVRGAREVAESASQKASAASAEYHDKLQRARAEVYGQMDDMRRSALDKRAALLGETRQTVESELSTATAHIRQESETARAALDRDADDLAGAIVARVLGRAS
jgi:F-type H+-transporting ATPase subunit b